MDAVVSKGIGKVGKSSLSRMVHSAVSNAGGVSGASHLKEAFRPGSQAYWKSVYEGKTAEQATRIATHLKEPIKIAVYTGKKGGLEIIDGRHRMRAAKEAGAKKIRVTVRVYGERTGSRNWSGVLKL
jgi:hypothetical protein